MAHPLTAKFTLGDLRAARTAGRKVPMLTCYDYTTAGLMEAAGVPMLLVGDSAANVVLGYPSTVPVSLDFLIELTAAVRRGAANAMVVGDLPFGSYGASDAQGVKSAVRMLKETGCDAVKLEVSRSHKALIERLADIGVAAIAHLGLKPQSVNVLGGYRYQGRTADEAHRIVKDAEAMAAAGAVAILLEAVPPEVAAAVVEAVGVPVIGCGAGPACHGYVVVTPDALGLTNGRVPRFVPQLSDLRTPMVAALARYVDQVASGAYPAADHSYEMPVDQREQFLAATARAANDDMPF